MSKPIKKKREVVCKSIKHLGVLNESGMTEHLCEYHNKQYFFATDNDCEDCCTPAISKVTCIKCRGHYGSLLVDWLIKNMGMTDEKEDTKKKTKVRNKCRNPRRL